MRGPKRHGLLWRGGAEAVLIRGGGPVLDIGVTLEPSQRLRARRHMNPDERQEGGEEREAEGAKHHTVEQRREEAPQLDERHHEKQRDDEERPEQGLPD